MNVAAPPVAIDDAELPVLAIVVCLGQTFPNDRRRIDPHAEKMPGRPDRKRGSRAPGSPRLRLPARAHGTAEPTARNFDATATPHSGRNRAITIESAGNDREGHAV